MLFTDTMALASTPRQLFDLVLARCVRGACCTDIFRLDGLSWTQFMRVNALAVERISNVVSDTSTPCFCIPAFVLKHPDRPAEEVSFAICSFPRHRSFIIVSTNMFWRIFGVGAETMRLILQCTPTPTVPLVNVLEPFVPPWALNQGAGGGANESEASMSEKFVNELVNKRRRELGMAALSTS